MLDSLDTLIAFVLIMLVVSLLITIVVQMFATGLNLRGVNLAQGLKMTFGVIDPQSEEHAKQLANYILKGRYLSDSYLPDWPVFRLWRHATAVRPREVFDAIQRIALDREPGYYISKWRQLTKKPNIDLKDKATRILQGLGVAPAEIAKAHQAIVRGEEVAKQFTDAAEAAYENFDYWTCTCQERAQQWLTMHTRILTVIFSIFFAFWLQLDAVEIFKLVSSNKAVRDKIVAQATGVTAQADKVFRDSQSVLQKAFEAWPDKTDATVQSALGSIKVEPNDTREKLTDRITTALASVPNEDAHLKSFNDTIDKTATDILKDKAGDYNAVKADFENTGFDLFPKTDKGRWGNGTCWNGSQGHRWGILFSVGLLSLGAPFWYNALKNLVNLRSQVAQTISTEQKKKPAEPSEPPPPPTPIPPKPQDAPAPGDGQTTGDGTAPVSQEKKAEK